MFEDTYLAIVLSIQELQQQFLSMNLQHVDEIHTFVTFKRISALIFRVKNFFAALHFSL